jgi:hypothetical protein
MAAREEWVERLRHECERSSQAQVARLVGYSSTTILRVLNGTYEGDLAAVRKAVEGALMGATVVCPVEREIPSNQCLENQKAPFAATNPTRVALYKACRSGCPHSRLGEWEQR